MAGDTRRLTRTRAARVEDRAFYEIVSGPATNNWFAQRQVPSTSKSASVRPVSAAGSVLSIARNDATLGVVPLAFRRGGAGEVSAGLVVERLGRHVEAVGPRDGSCLRVDGHACEVLGIAQRLEDAAPVASREVDVADGAILEGQTQPVVTDHLDSRDIHE